MQHPFYNYTTEDALRLARIHLHPLGTSKDELPLPSIPEALRVLEDVQRRQGFNWITGRVAIELLRAESGENVTFTP